MYKDDKKEGLETWDTKGYMGFSFPITVRSMYAGGKKQGVTEILTKHPFEDNLAEPYVIATIDYDQGLMHGNFKTFDENGTLLSVVAYTNGKRYLSKTFDKSGKVASLRTYNNMPTHGIEVRWRSNGTPITCTFYIDGTPVAEDAYRKRSAGNVNLPYIGAALDRESVLSELKWRLISEQTDGAVTQESAPSAAP
jgi:hypothetical protein